VGEAGDDVGSSPQVLLIPATSTATKRSAPPRLRTLTFQDYVEDPLTLAFWTSSRGLSRRAPDGHPAPGRTPEAPGGGPSLFLDTWAANVDLLREAGVPASQIHIARVCTSCYRQTFHSYRVDGDRAGRMIGVIRGKER